MSVTRALLPLSAVAVLLACENPTRSTLPQPEEVVVESEPGPNPAPEPAPEPKPGAATMSMGTGYPVETPDGYFLAEVTATLMQWPDPIVGAAVTFTLVEGSGTLSATEVLTGADGVARTTIKFGLADKQVIQAHYGSMALARTTLHAWCAAAPEQKTLPCPPVE